MIDNSRTSRTADPSARRGILAGWALDLGWRIALVVIAMALAARSAPTPLVAALTMVAGIVVAERIVRHRRRGMLDAALVGFGGLVIVAGLLGLVLNYLPGGITVVNWSLGAALLSIAALTATGLREDTRPTSPFRPLFGRAAVPTALWAVASVGVLTAALLLSIGSFDRTHVAPPDISSSTGQDGNTLIIVSAGSTEGPLELDLVTASGRTILASGISVSSSTSAVVNVELPSGSRALVQLVEPGSLQPLRELIFDSGATLTTRETR